jgi:hypothetical protein
VRPRDEESDHWALALGPVWWARREGQGRTERTVRCGSAGKQAGEGTTERACTRFPSVSPLACLWSTHWLTRFRPLCRLSVRPSFVRLGLFCPVADSSNSSSKRKRRILQPLCPVSTHCAFGSPAQSFLKGRSATAAPFLVSVAPSPPLLLRASMSRPAGSASNAKPQWVIAPTEPIEKFCASQHRRHPHAPSSPCALLPLSSPAFFLVSARLLACRWRHLIGPRHDVRVCCVCCASIFVLVRHAGCSFGSAGPVWLCGARRVQA